MEGSFHPYPRVAVSCIVRRQDRFLLVRRALGQAAGDFAFPGGKVESGERLSEAVVRELREETSLDGFNVRLFRLYDLISHATAEQKASHYLLAVHFADVSDDQTAIAGDDAASLGWFTLEETQSLSMPPSVGDCMQHVSKHGMLAADIVYDGP